MTFFLFEMISRMEKPLKPDYFEEKERNAKCPKSQS